MLTEICKYLRNWFELSVITGSFVISNGNISKADGTPLPLIANQYFRVIGSVFNDGVHKYGETMADEPEFSGAVWPMAVPPDFLTLVSDITQWCTDNAGAINSPYESESFGGYSYSKGIRQNSNGAGAGATWQSQFASRLSPWRKI